MRLPQPRPGQGPRPGRSQCPELVQPLRPLHRGGEGGDEHIRVIAPRAEQLPKTGDIGGRYYPFIPVKSNDHKIRRDLLTCKCRGDGSGAAAVGHGLCTSSCVGGGLGAPGGASGGNGVAGSLCRGLDNSLSQGLGDSLRTCSVGLGNCLARCLGLSTSRCDGCGQCLPWVRTCEVTIEG